jgi:hypothetical protein
MIRPLRFLALAAALAFAATDAAAQTGGAFEVPLGEWEYRWLTRRDSQGAVHRAPATGHLRLHPNGRHAHLRDAGGTRMQSVGAYAVEGRVLYLPHVEMGTGRMVRDTFVVRRIGDRVLLWQEQGGETLEYTLAAPGAPVEPAIVPGVVTSVQGWIQLLTFFESDGGAVPRAERRYVTEFRNDSTRYINVQMDLSHTMLLEDRELAVACTFMHTELGARATFEFASPARRGNSSTGISTGWGAAEPGTWRPGTYQVLCTVDGVPAPEAGFVLR